MCFSQGLLFLAALIILPHRLIREKERKKTVYRMYLGSVLVSVHKSQTLHILDLLVHLRTICAHLMCEYD